MGTYLDDFLDAYLDDAVQRLGELERSYDEVLRQIAELEEDTPIPKLHPLSNDIYVSMAIRDAIDRTATDLTNAIERLIKLRAEKKKSDFLGAE